MASVVEAVGAALIGRRPSAGRMTPEFDAGRFAAISTPGMLWNDAPSCTSIFGTVYEPRNFTCGSHWSAVWLVSSVTRKLPNQRLNTPPFRDTPRPISRCALTENSQLYGRLPQP